MPPTVSVVIPAFNERATIARVLERVRAHAPPPDAEIVVVDDGSTDGTSEALRAPEAGGVARVLRHERNLGKGAAVRTGFAAARGDVLLVQDADLEYDPADYGKLLAPILDGRADVVFGSRFAGGEPHRVLYFWHSVANRALTLLSNAATNLNLTDMECGFKAFRREVVAGIELRERGFGFEPEVVAKVARRRVRVYEVGVSYDGRTYAEGKKIRARDGVRAVWCIVKYGALGL